MLESEFLNALINNVEDKMRDTSIEDLKQMHEDNKRYNEILKECQNAIREGLSNES